MPEHPLQVNSCD